LFFLPERSIEIRCARSLGANSQFSSKSKDLRLFLKRRVVPLRFPQCYHSPTMPPRKTAHAPAKSPAAQLDSFLDKFTPDIAAQAHTALRKMRARLPGAIELVYDNYNALAIGFASTDRASDAIFSIALYPRWISLFFLQNGTRLRNPESLLAGSGKQARHIVLVTPALLDTPAVQDLIAQALELAPKSIDPAQPRKLIIKSVSAKQRPRRPASK
jgi:hypothetical protein